MAAKELFSVAVTFIRMALLLFYYRLVGDTSLRHFRWALHFTMVLNMAVLIAFTFLTLLQCKCVYLPTSKVTTANALS